MDLKQVILALLFLGISLAGCAQEDACKPHNISFCLDKHRIWTCAPDGNPEKGSPAYMVQIVDCRTLGNGRNPYCVTSFGEENGWRGITQCRDKPMQSLADTDDAGRDVETDSD